MSARPALRRFLVLSCVLLATGSIAATLEAQEGASGFGAPTAAVPTPDGAMLVADFNRCVIERVDGSGGRTIVAGKVDDCATGPDGVPATESQLIWPTDAVPIQGGGFLISSFFDCRVREVGADGIITTVAGDGSCDGGSGDGGPATEAGVHANAVVPFNPPGQAVQIPGEGFLVTGVCSVRRIDGDGNIDTVAGNQNMCQPLTPQSIACADTMCAAGMDNGIVSVTTQPAAAEPLWENTRVSVSGQPLSGISCASGSFCAAIDSEAVHASADPAEDDPTWRSAPLAARSIECTSDSFCMAGASEDPDSGGIYRSTNPGSDSPDWALLPAASDPNDTVTGIDCIGTSFCAAVTQFGEVLTTTNASADPPAWSNETISAGSGLVGISCASESVCVAAGGDDELYVSRNADEADPTWTGQGITNDVEDVSCPATGLCVAIDQAGNTLTSTDVDTDDPDWTERDAHAQHGLARLRDVSCASQTLCAAIENGAPDDAADLHYLISTNAGTGSPTWPAKLVDPGVREGVPATSQALRNPISAVPTPDGGFLIAEVGEFSGPDAGQGSRVRKVAADGTIRTVAGTGVRGYSGDGGPATSAQLYQPTSAIPTPDGGFLISEITNCVVRKVGADGIIRRVAGVAPSSPGSLDNCGANGSGGPATGAQLQRPTSAVPFPDGSMVIGSFGVAGDPDDRTAPLARVLPSGTITNALFPFVQPVDNGGGTGPGPQPQPQPQPGPGGPGATPLACTVKAASSSVRGPKPKSKRRRKRAKKPGVLKTAVTCNQAASVKVSGKLKLVKKRKGRKRPKRKTYALKARTGSAQANAPLTVKLKVPKKVLRSILKGGKGSVDLALTATGAGGSTTAAAKLARLKVTRQR